MDLHELGEERSLAYHAQVAALVRQEPARLDRARARVEDWLTTGAVHPSYALSWRALLRGPLDALCLVLEDRSERARALRQVTPFAGFLPPRERWAIWRETKAKLTG